MTPISPRFLSLIFSNEYAYIYKDPPNQFSQGLSELLQEEIQEEGLLNEYNNLIDNALPAQRDSEKRVESVSRKAQSCCDNSSCILFLPMLAIRHELVLTLGVRSLVIYGTKSPVIMQIKTCIAPIFNASRFNTIKY